MHLIFLAFIGYVHYKTMSRAIFFILQPIMLLKSYPMPE